MPSDPTCGIPMGLQAIETTSPKGGNSVFLVDQNPADRITAHGALAQGVSFLREGASIAFAPTHWLLGSHTVEEDFRGTSRVVARAFVAVGLCVLGLFIEAAGDRAL